MGRGATGVTGIKLKGDDYVIDASVCRDDETLLTITENGYGKKTSVSEFKVQYRGGKGVTGYKITEKTGLIAGMSIVNSENDIMLITTEGVVIRMDVDEISEFGRVTQGVRVMRLDENVKIKSIEKTQKEEPEEVTSEE
jgi:DNA gyrase subunit A